MQVLPQADDNYMDPFRLGVRDEIDVLRTIRQVYGQEIKLFCILDVLQVLRTGLS